ncbi:MAG: NAD(P)/FAD-dependent oxidoreductase [Candidatus Norongarragalinales archaeon]
MYDVAIIGGGPAGLSAAIYASRKNLKTVLFEEEILGGAVSEAWEVENYLGFGKRKGAELASAFVEHAKQFPVEFKEFEKIDSIKKVEEGFFRLSTSSGEYEARAVILATGMRFASLGVTGEEDLVGRGVSYCATCDGPMFKGKRVAVVGGGDSAFSSALYLSELAEKTYLVHRRAEFKAVELLQKQLKAKAAEGKVEILSGKVVKELKTNAKGLLEKIVLEDTESKQLTEISVEGLFVYLGGMPLSVLAQSVGVALDEKGFVKTDSECATSVPGVFAAGDITGWGMQIITAAATGAVAALSAYKHVKFVTTR